MKKNIIMLIFISFLLLPMCFAEDDSTGTAEVIGLSINSVTIDKERSDDIYTISFTVTHPQTINSLTNITITIWEETTSTYSSANNQTNHYTFKWTPNSWSEISLTGHYSSSINPTNLDVTSGDWELTPTFDPMSIVGQYNIRIEAYSSDSSVNSNSSVIRDKLKILDIFKDIPNEKLNVQLGYSYDDQIISVGTIYYAGLYAFTGPTGWGEFTMSSIESSTWETTCYGISDYLYDITESEIYEVEMVVYDGTMINGNVTIENSSWDGTNLIISFEDTTGWFSTDISGDRPTYVLGAKYDFDNYETTTINHDASQDIIISYTDWNGLYIRGLTYGYLESIDFTNNVLSISTNGETGEGIIYINCTGYGVPTETQGFDEVWFNSNNNLFWGVYILSSPQNLILNFNGGTGSTGGSVTRYRVITIDIKEVGFKSISKKTTEAFITIEWTGIKEIPTVIDLEFGKYSEYLTLKHDTPFKLEQVKFIVDESKQGTNQIKGEGKIPIIVDPLSTGTYDIPVEIRFSLPATMSIKETITLVVIPSENVIISTTLLIGQKIVQPVVALQTWFMTQPFLNQVVLTLLIISFGVILIVNTKSEEESI